MRALLRHRPYALHGERIAVAAGLQFLSLNRWRADLASRQYFAGPDAVRGTPDPDAPSGPAGFSVLALASQQLAIT
jgi:hypothetical protein